MTRRLLTAAELARELGTSRDWVYQHADTLPGTLKLGKGPRPRLRFDLDAVIKGLKIEGTATGECVDQFPPPVRRPQAAPSSSSPSKWLPIKGTLS